MRVVVQSLLPCDADLAWIEVQKSRLLEEVAAPLIAFRAEPGAKLPAIWKPKEVIRCRSYLFGLLPLGTRTLVFRWIDPVAREIQTHESDRLVARWDHLIGVSYAGKGWCRYRDEIEIEAGWRTIPVWLFAQCFYRHRQRRWRRVAKRLQQQF